MDTPFGPSGLDTERSTSRYTDADLSKYLVEYRGNISATARHLNVRRRSVADRISSSPDLKDLLLELRDNVIDRAEQNVFESVENGDLGESRFILTTLGKERGYVPRQENKHDPISVGVRQFTDPEPNSAPETPDEG